MSEIVEMLGKNIQPIGDAFDPASEGELVVAEQELGVKLPDLFREIQKAYGRCMISGEGVVRVDNAEPLGIFTLFGCKGNAGNLIVDFRAHPDQQAQKLIPIADDLFNNRYVWDATSNRVLFIDYAKHSSPTPIAQSFADFLARIQVTPD